MSTAGSELVDIKTGIISDDDDDDDDVGGDDAMRMSATARPFSATPSAVIKSSSTFAPPTSAVQSMVNMTSSRSAHPKEKKKKKKRKVLTKAEKEKLAMDKAANAVRQSGERFLLLIDRLDRWLKDNHAKAIEMFTQFNPDGVDVVTYPEFKAGMRDLGVPCNDIELHLLSRLFDKEKKNVVQFNRLATGLAFVRNQEELYRMEDIRPSLHLSQRQFLHCHQGDCSMAQWHGETYKLTYPRFVEIQFCLLPFDSFKNHPGHLTILFPTHLTVFHLSKLICDQTGIQTTQIIIFKDKSQISKSTLSPDLSLEDCGFIGGTKNSPKKIKLFYDYSVDFKDCPILLCDHYFGRTLKINYK